MPQQKNKTFALLALALVASVWMGLRFGSVADLNLEWILELRLPRVVVACGVGLGLAVAGVVVQSLFANPICDPYSLGISSGGTLGAVFGLTMGGVWVPSVGGTWVWSFFGAALFGGIMVAVSRRRHLQSHALLLVGVVMGLVGSSLVTVWVALTDPIGISQAMVWLLGDLSRLRTPEAVFFLLSVIAISVQIWSQHERLDLLLLGEEDAQTLGLDLVRTRNRLLFWVCILVGFCVSAAGMIGFVGLVIPHLARRPMGPRHKMVLPLAAMMGAIFMVWADLVGRAIKPPIEIPAGVIAALIGSPLFIWILIRRGHAYER